MESISPSQEPTHGHLHPPARHRGEAVSAQTLYTEVGTQVRAQRIAQYKLTEQMAIKEWAGRADVEVKCFLQSHQPSLAVALAEQLPP